MKKITIGILAHVDSGKTTLSEAILYKTGVIRQFGRVDHGSAFMDSNEIEQDRGITIFSNQATFTFKDAEITLVDTPGHVDFSAETERALGILDCAILVISGTDGVQSHTETLWKLIKGAKIPVFIFVNKMDISPYSRDVITENIRSRFGDKITDMENPDPEDIALLSENLMESFLKGEEFSEDDLRSAVKSRKMFPLYSGSALKLTGIDEILSGISSLAPSPHFKKDFGAKVYKIAQDENGERLTYMKLTGGALSVKDMVSTGDVSEKINQIRIYSGAKFKGVSSVSAGDVCAVSGLSKTYSGQGLGFEKDTNQSFFEPPLSYRVMFPKNIDIREMYKKFKILQEEDPQLYVDWNSNASEINFRVMGEVQLEVLKRIIADRFGVDVQFDYSSIAYKETIETSVEGIGHFEPLRHYAEVHLLLEPTERGEGISFSSSCTTNQLDKNWQRLILTHLYEKKHIGVLGGFPITDMKITLIAGRAHLKHTEGGDFREATYRAVRHGLMRGKSVLLEPWYSFKIELPSENTGRAMTDIQNMGGRCDTPKGNGEITVLTGSAPVSEMRGYQQELISYSHGNGRISLTLCGYEKCHNQEEVIEYTGYDAASDILNTADSVFCSHGAGFNVPWYEVENYQHIDTGLNLLKEAPEEKKQRAVDYIRRVADDSELMRIFEMTYGPVNKPTHKVFKKASEPKVQKPPKPVKQLGGDQYLLIDGYNIIFAWKDLKSLAEKNLELARQTLISRVSNYGGFMQCKIILVFDAYKVHGNPGSVEEIGGISVVYTKEAETADMYIEKVTHKIAKENRVRVATSDNLEQLIIIGNGAVRVSAEAFLAEVKDAEKQINDLLKDGNGFDFTIGDIM